MQTLVELKAKIQSLETERSQLISDIENLRKTAEFRVMRLEGEVNQMREEAKTLRELLGNTSKATVSASNVPKSQISSGSR
jgi:hypothetical protein